MYAEGDGRPGRNQVSVQGSCRKTRRAIAAAAGRGRECSHRAGRDFGGFNSDRCIAAVDPKGDGGIETGGLINAAGPGASSGRWPQEGDRTRSEVAAGFGEVGGAGHTGRPAIAVALDLQERPELSRRVESWRSPDEPSNGGRAAAGHRLQPAGEPQDAGRPAASRPQRPV